jgi:hypothetical protein
VTSPSSPAVPPAAGPPNPRLHSTQRLEPEALLTLSSHAVAVNGSRVSCRLCCAAVFFLFAGNPSGMLATADGGDGPGRGEDGLASLLAGFAAMPGLAARFREERHLGLLKEPLVSHGALYFAPPDRLARHVEAPFPSRLVVRGDHVEYGTAADGGGIDLSASPVLGSFVEAFRLLLRGDVRRLRHVFSVRWTPTGRGERGDSWHLSLSPRREPLKGIVESLEVTGRGRLLSSISIREVRGDRTEMTFSDVDPDRRFPMEEAARIFQLQDP